MEIRKGRLLGRVVEDRRPSSEREIAFRGNDRIEVGFGFDLGFDCVNERSRRRKP